MDDHDLAKLILDSYKKYHPPKQKESEKNNIYLWIYDYSTLELKFFENCCLFGEYSGKYTWESIAYQNEKGTIRKRYVNPIEFAPFRYNVQIVVWGLERDDIRAKKAIYQELEEYTNRNITALSYDIEHQKKIVADAYDSLFKEE